MDEIEVKFKISKPNSIRKKLRGLGAAREGLIHEKNIIFNTVDGKFKKAGKMLRLRDANGYIITYKGPEDKSHEFKKRHEINLRIKDADMIIELFAAIGYVPDHVYEKKRETWYLEKVNILIDEIPLMGFFVEIEGDTEEIKKAIKSLGFENHEPITKTYIQVYNECQKSQGIEPTKDMVFE